MQGYRKDKSSIRECLPIPQKLYNVTKRLKNREEVEQYFPGFMAFTDCTEQPIPRPKNRLRRRLYYSGKRKETYSQKPVYDKPEGTDNLQNKAQANR